MRARIGPPCSTRTSHALALDADARAARPGRPRAGCGRRGARRSPAPRSRWRPCDRRRSSRRSGRDGRPVSSTAGPVCPVRIFGPHRSWRIATCLPSAALSARTISNRAPCSSCVPCEKLSRATSMPASISPRMPSRVSTAGPMVQTIFARRAIMGISVGLRTRRASRGKTKKTELELLTAEHATGSGHAGRM